MNDVVVASGLIQLTVAVWMGWAMFGFVLGKESVGPFKDKRRTLQCHLDNIMMGTIQMALAGAIDQLPTVPTVLILIGSWLNPQFFLLMAIKPDLSPRIQAFVNPLVLASFVTLSIGYPWLTMSTVLG